MIWRVALRFALAVLLAASLGAQTETGWRVGLARVKITPDEPTLMDGYASRRTPFEGVDSDIYAKAMALEDSDGRRALLITAEILGFAAPLAERICRRLEKEAGLDRAAILLQGSHTHAGPMVIPHLGGGIAPEHREAVERYAALLEEKVVRVASDALADLAPAGLSWGAGVAPFVMNRREFTSKGVVLGANPRGLADRTVPVLQVASPDGRPRAVVFGAATHPTTLGGQNLRLSGDYPGFAMQYFEAAHPGVQAMFLIGCAGDANPFPRGTLEIAKSHGRTLSDEVSRVLAGPLEPVRGPLRTQLRRVDLPLQQLSRPEIEKLAEGAPTYRRFFADSALRLLDDGQPLPAHYNAPFALWQFGEDLTLVGFSGETVVDYVRLTEEALRPLKLWVAGYCNDVYGYLPTARVLAEGGYETRGLYTAAGLFEPGVEKVVMGAVKEMADAAGRPMSRRTQ